MISYIDTILSVNKLADISRDLSGAFHWFQNAASRLPGPGPGSVATSVAVSRLHVLLDSGCQTHSVSACVGCDTHKHTHANTHTRGGGR